MILRVDGWNFPYKITVRICTVHGSSKRIETYTFGPPPQHIFKSSPRRPSCCCLQTRLATHVTRLVYGHLIVHEKQWVIICPLPELFDYIFHRLGHTGGKHGQSLTILEQALLRGIYLLD